MLALGYCLIIIFAFGYSLNIVVFWRVRIQTLVLWFSSLGLVPFFIWIGWVGSQVLDLIFSPRIGLEVDHPLVGL